MNVNSTHSIERKRVWDMKKRFNIKGVTIILTIGYVCYILIYQQTTMSRQKKQLQNYSFELQKKREENKVLQDEVELSKTDKYMEKLAREVLGLVKEGETPVLDNEN